MDGGKIEAQDKIFDVIKKKKNFVLQGGAGSGKTETLKKVIHTISKEYSTNKIACITYTNLAADEIKERVGNEYTICTIHSFLNDVIKNYKKNIHQVIKDLFIVPKIERKDISFYLDEKEQNKLEFANFKKVYGKYSNMLWIVKKESNTISIGKRDYDKEPEKYNYDLNTLIDKLNECIIYEINKKNYNEIKYNETKFNNLENLSFGHDGLLEISVLLLREYPILLQIIQDKYDYIFIDEYQDTNKDLIDIFVKSIGNIDSKTIIGLFGDSMQGIYEDGIGDVVNYIDEKCLEKIDKEDNYRSSKQVIEFANKYRNDGMIQKIALKTEQKINDREGVVKLYYSIYNKSKPTLFSKNEDKEEYLNKLFELIKEVEDKNPNYKKLMLTNKSISGKLDFKNLYELFDYITQEVNEKIEKDFDRLQLSDLVDLCNDYKNKNYNLVLTKVVKAGFKLKNVDDKDKLSEILKNLLESDIDCFDALEIAFSNNLIKKSKTHEYYITSKDKFLKELEENKEYKLFKKNYNDGGNTFTRMKKIDDSIEEEVFDDYLNKYKKEKFFKDFFDNNKVPFKEIINYKKYINQKTDYITMHKTKGSGIDNVLIVLDEFFWNKYDFSSIFNVKETNLEKKLKNQKLFYVACSRAINNLICVKLIQEEEKDTLIDLFEKNEEINL